MREIEIFVLDIISYFHHFRFVDSDNPMVQETLSEMEAFSPIGSNILNKSGVKTTTTNNKHQEMFC